MADYPTGLDVRPLTAWPGDLTPAHKRVAARFGASLSSTLEVLTRELNALAVKHPVMEVAIPTDPGNWRIDGRPRANARPSHPGVVLSLPSSNVGPLRYATDLFMTWQDNLRAIALGMEALRKVDRYGITRRGEQYAGFKALPSGAATPMPTGPAEQMTVDQAARTLIDAANLPREHVEGVITDRAERTRAFRLASHVHHPDVGGQRDAWDLVEQARRVLDEHAGGRP